MVNMRLQTSLVTLVLIAIGGCYNPDLGSTPFKCATSGKTCPDDYRCVERNGNNVCVPNSESIDDAGPIGDVALTKDSEIVLDGATVQASDDCLDKDEEPNNSGSTAKDLPGLGEIPGWEICYPGDVDLYGLRIESGVQASITIKFFHSKGDLELALLAPDGSVIAASRSEDNNELVQATVTQTARYLIAVWGFGEATNTYDINVTLR